MNWKKADLLKLCTLKATPKMMQMAAADIAKRKQIYRCTYVKAYEIGLYMRCQTLQGILKVAFFLPDKMKAGGNLPVYELFINKDFGEFLTYDCIGERWLTGKLDMLTWPEYVRYSEKKWIAPEGHASIKSYLGTTCGGYEGLLEYQLQVRADALKRRHKRTTDPWDLALSQTPELPKDWKRWMAKTGISENYIFYRYDKKGVTTGYCTFCEQDVPIHKPKHNKAGTCPHCRHAVTYKSLGKQKYFVETKPCYMYLVQKCECGFIIREFIGSRRHRMEDYRNGLASAWEFRRVLCDKAARPFDAYYWGDYKQYESRWIQDGVCAADYWGDHAGYVYGKSLPVLAKAELSRTGLPELIRDGAKVDPEKYLQVLRKCPQLELLSKAHLPYIALDCVHSYGRYKDAFAKAKKSSLAKVLGIDADELRRLRKNKGNRLFLDWLRFEKATGKRLPDRVIAWFSRENIQHKDLRFISDRMSYVQIYNYLRRQIRENGQSSEHVLTTWADYLSMAQRQKLDVSDTIIYRVRLLYKRHAELVKECNSPEMAKQANEIANKYPKVEEIYQAIKPLYEFAGTDYQVIVPQQIEDILLEGRKLHHCVGSVERYFERTERRESYVLFLRCTSDPEKSYYTLEVEPGGTVRQKRTMYDRQEKDIDQAKKFLKQWQAAITERLTEQEIALAKKSKALRIEGFDQMRRDRVTIHTGELHGKLLVDVLMADLMENEEVKTA